MKSRDIPQITGSKKTEIPARSRQLGIHTGKHSKEDMKTTKRARSRQIFRITGDVKKVRTPQHQANYQGDPTHRSW